MRRAAILAAICALGCGPSEGDVVPADPSAADPALADLYVLERLPRPREGVYRMFSSYDRTGGNDDGFEGTWSALRVEDGHSVLAEMDGPGVLTRLWFTHSSPTEDGLLGGQGEHLRIYLDGSAEPAIDTPLEDVFSGALPEFPAPLAGYSLGGFFAYVPIPFAESCKVVVEGTHVRFYQVGWLDLPDDAEVDTWSGPPPDEQVAALDEAWADPGPIFARGARTVGAAVTLPAGGRLALSLPPGPRFVREVRLDHPADLPDARVRIWWDGAPEPAVDVPLDLFFASPEGAVPFASVLAVRDERGFVQRLPMPYAVVAHVEIEAREPLDAHLEIVTVPAPDNAWLYAHAADRTALPAVPDRFVRVLHGEGRGHYVGLVLSTVGPRGDPWWLEGDESVRIDGDLVAHGTGTEDHFNAGWWNGPGRLDHAEGFPTHGFVAYGPRGPTRVAAAYRWHLLDPVPFDGTVSVRLEHGPRNDVAADYRVAALWYSDAP